MRRALREHSDFHFGGQERRGSGSTGRFHDARQHGPHLAHLVRNARIERSHSPSRGTARSKRSSLDAATSSCACKRRISASAASWSSLPTRNTFLSRHTPMQVRGASIRRDRGLVDGIRFQPLRRGQQRHQDRRKAAPQENRGRRQQDEARRVQARDRPQRAQVYGAKPFRT
ncbi:hypothetical protein [Dokdonella sp.]|uniref:hypothetical protein n=1 Tax=Dokdonella sp. TaxID=2291710 RepID=UPI002617061D|nr:hypothetical protein [Dokdonella sp.]